MRLVGLLGCTMFLLAVPTRAGANDRQDIALALAVDVSISVSAAEKNLQRRGYS